MKYMCDGIMASGASNICESRTPSLTAALLHLVEPLQVLEIAGNGLTLVAQPMNVTYAVTDWSICILHSMPPGKLARTSCDDAVAVPPFSILTMWTMQALGAVVLAHVLLK